MILNSLFDASNARRQARERIRAACSCNLHAFYRYAFPVLVPEATFIDAWHFRVLATALQKVATGEIRRLLIAIPPRHGKSRLASVALPTWILGREPTAKIICASYGQDLARDFAMRSRELLNSRQCQAIFPGLALERGGQGLEELRTTQKGYRLATSVQGVVTGKGADYIIIDDPIKAVDATSDVARNQAYEWVKTTLMSRFDRPSEGRMVVIMQRLHMDDLIGRLRDEGGWTVLEMPGEGVERQEFDLGDGSAWEFQPGELLYPEVFDEKALKQLRYDLGEAAYNAQILQRPAPPGGHLFKLKHFQRYEKLPTHFEAIVQSWDPAIVDGDDTAFTVCTTWGIVGQKLYLIDVFRKRLQFYQIEKVVLSLREKFNATHVIIEAAGVGVALVNALLRLERSRSWLSWAEPRLSKLERAMEQTPKIERRRVYLPTTADWLATFEAEVAQFPFSKFADQVDSMVHFLHALDSRNGVTHNLSVFRDWPKNAF